jgi:hypothetical protein
MQNAVKSCKQVTKNLNDMSKEVETIGQVTSVGDLPEKLQEAEEAKGEVESQLLDRVSQHGTGTVFLLLLAYMDFVFQQVKQLDHSVL